MAFIEGWHQDTQQLVVSQACSLRFSYSLLTSFFLRATYCAPNHLDELQLRWSRGHWYATMVLQRENWMAECKDGGAAKGYDVTAQCTA